MYLLLLLFKFLLLGLLAFQLLLGKRSLLLSYSNLFDAVPCLLRQFFFSLEDPPLAILLDLFLGCFESAFFSGEGAFCLFPPLLGFFKSMLQQSQGLLTRLKSAFEFGALLQSLFELKLGLLHLLLRVVK